MAIAEIPFLKKEVVVYNYGFSTHSLAEGGKMPYYVRSFCCSPEIPSLASLENFLKRKYPDIHLESASESDLKNWTEAEFHYKPDKKPVILEVNRNNSLESMAASECKEFVEEIAELEESTASLKVISHLKNTKYVVSCQLLSDIDDDGYERNGELLYYFVINHKGIVQADGEGFYDGSNIIIELS